MALVLAAVLCSPVEPKLVDKLQQNRESAEPTNADAHSSRNLLTPIVVQYSKGDCRS
jgi:hypothetical protein